MKRILLIIAVAVAAVSARAEDSKFLNLSLTPDVALYSKSTQINGVTLSIWGENPQSALALGFVNGSSGKSQGVSLGLVNYAESYKGLQWGMVNYSSELFVGVQAGFVNVAKEVHGLQWGAVNYTESMNGVQIGFLNIIKNNPWFDEFPSKLAKGFVFVNWSF